MWNLKYGGDLKNKDNPSTPMDEWDDVFYKGSGVHKLIEEGLKRNILVRMKLLAQLKETEGFLIMQNVGLQKKLSLKLLVRA